MSKISHIYRRGNTLYFRLSVPDRYRSILHVSEFTQSLRTQNRQQAIPAAYKLAGDAKQLFLCLDRAMTKGHSGDDLLEAVIKELEADDLLLEGKKLKLGLKRKAATIQVNDLKLRLKNEELENENLSLVLKHREDLQAIENKTKADAFDKLNSFTAGVVGATQQNPISKTNSKAPLISVAYNQFVNSHPANQRKLITFGNLFIDGYLGDIKIDLITQKDVNTFFKLLVRVAGGRGGYSEAYTRLNIHERIADAEKCGGELMGLSTFTTTYLTSARQFFGYLRFHYEDHAPIVSVDHINYKDFGGLRAKGENKQRALKIEEVKLLVNNHRMQSFCKTSNDNYKFWLVMLGLFTGARVNEICQINPQTDVIQDEKSGIWYFNLTDEGISGVGVNKSLKNVHSFRKVPIHSALIRCGLLDYIDRIKSLKHDRIFNGFRPKDGKASYYAEEFFRNYLKDIHLYDNKTKGKNVLGMHCLRGSFISHLARCLMRFGLDKKQAISKIQPIVGHSSGLSDENGKDISITAGYVDDSIIENVSDGLEELKGIIEALDYGLVFQNS